MTYNFSQLQRKEAMEVAKETARVDNNTHESESLADVRKNKMAGHLGEIAVKEYCEENGLSYTWVSNQDDSEPPHDFIIEGVKVDVKSSTNVHKRCNLMLSDRMTSQQRDNDSFILVRIEKDMSEAEIYGGITVEDFNEYSHYFRTCQQDRMMNDELIEPTVMVGAESRFNFTK